MYTKNLNPANIFMKFFRFSDFQVLFGLFRTTQDTIFFVLVVYTFAGVATLGTEIEVAMKVENEHLTEIPHLGVLRVRSKSGEVFCFDAVALDGEGIHQHRTEAPFVGIVTKTDMMVELAVLQRLAPEVIVARGYFAEELPTLVHAHDTCANARIEMGLPLPAERSRTFSRSVGRTLRGCSHPPKVVAATGR